MEKLIFDWVVSVKFLSSLIWCVLEMQSFNTFRSHSRIWKNGKFCTIAGKEACLCDYLLHNWPLHGPFWERPCIIDVLSASHKDYKTCTLVCIFAPKAIIIIGTGIKLVCLRISALSACHRLWLPTDLTAWHHPLYSHPHLNIAPFTIAKY